MLPNMRNLIKKHLPVLHSDSNLRNIFPESSICTVLKRNRNLKEILSSSLYTKNKKENKSYVIKNWRKCDICKNYLISVVPSLVKLPTRNIILIMISIVIVWIL